MKHKTVKTFKDYPPPLQLIIITHIVLAIVSFAYSFTRGYMRFITFLALTAAFAASGIGLYNRHEIVRQTLNVIYSFLAVICVLATIINIITLSPFIYALLFLIISFICFITSYYLSRPDILDCFFNPKDKHEMMTRKPY